MPFVARISTHRHCAHKATLDEGKLKAILLVARRYFAKYVELWTSHYGASVFPITPSIPDTLFPALGQVRTNLYG